MTDLADGVLADPGVALTWRLGSIRRATLTDGWSSAHGSMHGSRHLAALLALDAARGLDELTVVAHRPESLVTTVAAQPPPALTTLTLMESAPDNDDLMNGRQLGDLSPLWALPRLTTLCLGGGGASCGEVSAPRLESFTFIGGLDDDVLAALASARWPALRELSVGLGRYFFGSYAGMATDFGPALCRILPQTAYAAQLHALDLSWNKLHDADAAVLATAAPRFARLERLDVSDNQLSEDAIVHLRQAFPHAEVNDDGQYL